MKKTAALIIGTSLSLFAPLSQADFFSIQIGYGNFGYIPSPYYYPYQPYRYYSYYVPPRYYYRPYPYYLGYYQYKPYYRYKHRRGTGIYSRNYYPGNYKYGKRSRYYRYHR